MPLSRRLTILVLASTAISAKTWAEPSAQDALGDFLGSYELGSQSRRLNAEPRISLHSKERNTLEPSPAPAVGARTLIMSDVVVTAMGYLGKPYVYGSSSLNGGFDCSGFVLSLFQRTVGASLPRTAAEQAQATETIAKKELSPGDLVFFNTLRRQYSHVGIYVGDGRFIHSPRAGSSIRMESMEKAYWQKRFNGARRVAVNPLHIAAANTEDDS